MANRSNILSGRVYRVLEQYGMVNISIPEIYNRLSQAQNYIISESKPLKEFEISLEEDVTVYPINLNGAKVDIRLLKLYPPETWRYELKPKTISEWNELKARKTNINQPTGAIIIDNVFMLDKPPLEDGSMKIHCLLTGGNVDTVINSETQPIISNIYDDMFEYYAVEKMIYPEHKREYERKFFQELSSKPTIEKNNLPMPDAPYRGGF